MGSGGLSLNCVDEYDVIVERLMGAGWLNEAFACTTVTDHWHDQYLALTSLEVSSSLQVHHRQVLVAHHTRVMIISHRICTDLRIDPEQGGEWKRGDPRGGGRAPETTYSR